jgi:hypothetical protein
MKYFAIENSLNKTIMGKVEQTKDSVHHCDVWNDSNFIGKYPFKKIETTPILSNPVLYSASKLTDIINVSSVGFSYGSMIISDKFKHIFDKFNCYGVQFFPTYLIHKEMEVGGYWQTHIFDIPFDMIDYSKTKFYLKNSENRKVNFKETFEMTNYVQLHDKINSLEYPFSIYMDKVNFKAEMNYDYFFLRYFANNGSLGVVSERLKEEIEKQGITGIEFRPIELSLQEWYHSGEREKIYGKS